MGGQTSKYGGTGPNNCGAFELAMQSIANREGGVRTGGSHHESYFGGREVDTEPARSLREYEASLSAKTKEDVIRRLARALKRAGIDVDPEGHLDAIVKALVEQIPNPKNGKTFANEAKSQNKVCSVIADVLNDEFTPGVTKASEKFIDTSIGPVEMCRSVGEWAHSFAAGVNVEFLAVHASVKNSLRSIQILDEVMAKSYGKITANVDNAKNSKLSRSVEPLNTLYVRAQNERRRQEELLKNILNVQLAPAAMELELAMRDESEQNALIKRLGLAPGTSEFGDSLAMAISGLGTAASIAQRVHKALKLVGASISQYLESSEFAEFRRQVDEKLENNEIEFDKLAQFIESVEVLASAFSHRKESRFRAALEDAGKTGGKAPKRGGKGFDSDSDSDDEDDSSVVKRAKRQRREKKIILHDFAKRMSRNYDDMLSAVKLLGPKLGKEIPFSDRMDVLRDALVRLSDLRKDAVRLELSLVGYYMDAEARTLKENFTNAVRFVSSACVSVMEVELYRSSSPDFARLKAAIDGIEKTVDFFADVFAKKYGRYGVGGDEAAAGDEAAGGDEATGGADDDEELLPNISRNAISLTEAVNEFAYFYYVAKVRVNLDQTAAEIDNYSEDYAELLGNAVAARIHTLEGARNTLLQRFGDKERALAGVGTHGDAATFGNQPAGSQTSAQAEKMERTMHWIREEYATKIRFYKALQAIDLYMKAFTAGIVKDPDAVRDIKKMLDGTQANARWFNEQTGDSIWKAFECMGSVNTAGLVAPTAPAGFQASSKYIKPKSATAEAGGQYHYYTKLSSKMTDGVPLLAGDPEAKLPQPIGDLADHVGIPFIGANIDIKAAPGNAAKRHVSDAMDHYQALKNIINAFARVGEKFGGRELRAQVFMSPTQIYKTLIDYLKVSALSIHYSIGTPISANGTTPMPMPINCPARLAGVTMRAPQDILRPYSVYFGTIGFGEGEVIEGNYAIEDRFFAIAVKAMAAKVLTLLGVYDMLERTTPIYDLTPTRMIVGGGGGESNIEVLDGAAELYFRLPRLAEFYHMLKWDGEGTASYRIAMLPELEGTFSEIIRLVFLKENVQKAVEYSDNDMRIMIREINSIYTHFLSKHDISQVCQEALLAFVVEINRRYGLIKNTDMKKYWKMVNMARRGSDVGLNNTDYAILPGEDDTDAERRAPSDQYAVSQTRYENGSLEAIDPMTGNPKDRFSSVSRRGASIPTANWQRPGDNRNLLREFRESVDKRFNSVSRSNFRKVSYSLLIRQAQSQIKSAASADKKLEVVFKLIKGTSITTTDAFKGYMFHETVVLGLNSLSAVEALLRQFNDKITYMNPQVIENEIMDRVYARYITATAAGGAGAVDGTRLQHYNTANMEALFNTQWNMNDYIPGYTLEADKYQRYCRYLTGSVSPHDRRSGLVGDCTHANFRVIMALMMIEGSPAAGAIAAQRANRVDPATYNALPANYLLPCRPSFYSGENPNTGDLMKTPKGVDGNDVPGLVWTEERIIFLRSLRLYARFAVNYKLIMIDYVENVFALMGGMPIGQAGQRLVDVKFIPGSGPANFDGSIQIGFSKLRDVSESVLSEVKNYIDKFRPYIPKDAIEQFEKSGKEGSVKWIETNLVDKFFKGAFEGDAATRKKAAEGTLDGIARRAEDILTQLGRDTFISTRGIENLPALLAAPGLLPGSFVGPIQDPNWLTAANNNTDPNPTRREDFGQALSALIFYDSIDLDGGLMGAFKAFDPDINNALTRSVTRTAGAPIASGNPGEYYSSSSLGLLITRKVAAAPPAIGMVLEPIRVDDAPRTEASRLLLYRDDPTEYRSLLFAFNQLMARYLSTLKYVENGPRLYTNLINTFVNGAWASCVDDPLGNTWPDLINATAARDVCLGYRGDPKDNAILFQSLGFILQRIKTDVVSPTMNLPKHLVATLSEVPLHAKESYRANLPGFIKLFGFLHEKTIFIKQMMGSNCFSMARPSQLFTQAGAAIPLLAGGVSPTLFTGGLNPVIQTHPAGSLNALYPLDGAMSSQDMERRLGRIVDQITYAANTMRNAASEVLKELGDSPVYFETQEGSIESYKVSYGKSPLMPLSLSAWFLNDTTQTTRAPLNPVTVHLAGTFSTDRKLYPMHSLGSTPFKMQYGVRQLLTRTSMVSYDQIPGVKASLDEYNAAAPPNGAIDEKKNLEYVNSITTLLRFAVDCRNYKPMIASTNHIFSTESLVSPLPTSNGLIKTSNQKDTTVVWSLFGDGPISEESVVAVVEGSSQDEAVAKITARVSGSTTTSSRKEQCIYNLIDMNIVPINVHALMRDVPLVNIYNYEYTFEQMVSSLFGEQTSQFTVGWREGGLQDAATTSTRLMMLRLLNNPYIEVSSGFYSPDLLRDKQKGFIARIFRGDNNLGMGRPKFLSDQLYNKALFGSIYKSQIEGSNYDEAGPGVGAGHSRGQGSSILNDLNAAGEGVNGLLQSLRSPVEVLRALEDRFYHHALAGAINGARMARAAARRPMGTPAELEAEARRDLAPVFARAVANIIIGDFRAACALFPGLEDLIAEEIRAYHSTVFYKQLAKFTRLTTGAVGSFDELYRRVRPGVIAPLGAICDRISQGLADNILNTPTNFADIGVAYRNAYVRLIPLMDDLLRNFNRELNPRIPESMIILLNERFPESELIGTDTSTAELTYLGLREHTDSPVTAIKQVNVGTVRNRSRLEAIGKLRFDTYFVRKLFFITNIARVLRLKLNRELTQSRSVLPTSHMSVTPGITEYDLDPFAPNETYASRIGDGYEYNQTAGRTPIITDESGTRRGMTRFADEMPDI